MISLLLILFMINLCSVIFKGLHRPSGILFGVSICVLCMQTQCKLLVVLQNI